MKKIMLWKIFSEGLLTEKSMRFYTFFGDNIR